MKGFDMEKIIDLRSDTVTKPSPKMREVISKAQVGDDVYEEDPTVNRLEKFIVEIVRMESSLFLPTATQSNLVAIISHCERGEEYITGNEAHNYKFEGGGASVLGGVQAQPIPMEIDGTLNLEKVVKNIKLDDIHFVKTKLLSLENTFAGKVLSLEYQKQAWTLCKERNLLMHLDGARVFNAAVSLRVDVKDITQYYDSVTLCMSKGLGAPAGALLCGSSAFIKKARRWRKVVGGGMRQVGILASACQLALEENISRLKEDHENAALLAKGFREIKSDDFIVEAQHTNMVFVKVNIDMALKLRDFLKKQGIIILVGLPNLEKIRFVTHLDINKQDIEKVVDCVRAFYK